VLREQARSKCHDGRSNGRTRASHSIVSTRVDPPRCGPGPSRHPASARGQAAPRRCQRDDCPVSHRCRTPGARRVSAPTRHLLTNRLVERRLLRDRPPVSAHEEEGHTRRTGADGLASEDVVRVRAIRACVNAPENQTVRPRPGALGFCSAVLQTEWI
jgi:hypothetical protein